MFFAARRKPLRFSLKLMLILVSILCLFLGRYVNYVNQVFRQKSAVAYIQKIGGRVRYDSIRNAPGWIVNRCGEDWFQQVDSIDLSNTPTTDEDLLRILPPLQHSITILKLSGTKITDLAFERIKRAEALNYLDLSDTSVTGSGLYRLANLKKLESLDLMRTKVTDTTSSALAELKSLKYLRLGGNDITSLTMPYLKSLRLLNSLSLGATKIDDSGLKFLDNLPWLTYIGSKNTNVSDKGRDHLERLMKKNRETQDGGNGSRFRGSSWRALNEGSH
jgi:hypothetical protein